MIPDGKPKDVHFDRIYGMLLIKMNQLRIHDIICVPLIVVFDECFLCNKPKITGSHRVWTFLCMTRYSNCIVTMVTIPLLYTNHQSNENANAIQKQTCIGAEYYMRLFTLGRRRNEL